MIDAKGIEKVIPHRGDMRLIDEIREFDEVFKRYLSPQNPSDLMQGDITAVD